MKINKLIKTLEQYKEMYGDDTDVVIDRDGYWRHFQINDVRPNSLQENEVLEIIEGKKML